MEKECHPRGVIADETNREGLACFVHKHEKRAPDLSALGMARQLPQILSTRSLEIPRWVTPVCIAQFSTNNSKKDVPVLSVTHLSLLQTTISFVDMQLSLPYWNP